MKVALVYFDGCPNTERARSNLKDAFEEIGMKPEWDEWEQSDPAFPEHLKSFGSPSIIIDGNDVVPAGEEVGCGQSCRLYEGGEHAPSVETIKNALSIRGGA